MAENYSVEYADLADEQLIELARGYDGLVPEAQKALRAEFSKRGLLPPLVDGSVFEQDHRLVTIRHFRDLTEALVARSVLENGGLLCFLQDENLVRMDWAYSNLIGGMRLQVPDDQVAMAEELLAGPSGEHEGSTADADTLCPKCGSFSVEAKTPGHGLAAASLFLFGLPLPRRERVWLCQRCGTRWIDTPDDA